MREGLVVQGEPLQVTLNEPFLPSALSRFPANDQISLPEGFKTTRPLLLDLSLEGRSWEDFRKTNLRCP